MNRGKMNTELCAGTGDITDGVNLGGRSERKAEKQYRPTGTSPAEGAEIRIWN